MKTKVLALLLFLLPFSLATTTFAQYVQYGGVSAAQANNQVLIDKRILNPQNNQFVDNLNIEQHIFLPDQEVIFRVTVTNVTSQELKNIVVTDKLPEVVNFISTSFGSCDNPCKTVTINIDTLKVGESKVFEIKTRVKPAVQLPNTVTCHTNLSKVTAPNIADEDTSTFCVSKQVLGTTSEMPKTGPSQTSSTFLLSFLFLAISLLIKRILILERR